MEETQVLAVSKSADGKQAQYWATDPKAGISGIGIGQIVGQQDSRTAGQLRTADRRTAGTVLARYHQLPPTTWAWRAVLG